MAMSSIAAAKQGSRSNNWLLYPPQKPSVMEAKDFYQQRNRSQPAGLPFLQHIFNPATAHKSSQFIEDTRPGDFADVPDIPLYRASQPKRSLVGSRGSPSPTANPTAGAVKSFRAISPSGRTERSLPRSLGEFRRRSGSLDDYPRHNSPREPRWVAPSESLGLSGEHQDEISEATVVPIRSRPSVESSRIISEKPCFDSMHAPAARGPSATSSAETDGTSRSRAGSASSSYMTNATSLPALQQKPLDEHDQLYPLNEDDLDPGCFDLVVPADPGAKQYSLEQRSEQLFSTEHLRIIFSDPSLLVRFTSFLSTHRPTSVPVLTYYLDSIKALKALSYANSLTESLEPIEGLEFTQHIAERSINAGLQEKARQAFDALVREDLPAYITHIYIQTVSLSISTKIMGTLPTQLRQTSEGLAEVFCLTDPSRPGNPIVFASEEFHRTTQYGMSYVIGRNCRFLQGPKTNPHSVRRLSETTKNGREHFEVLLNYRRDGSPFMNLLMLAPLCDSQGTVRYFIGAQVDVSGLVKECVDLESLSRLVEASDASQPIASDQSSPHPIGRTLSKKDEFLGLSEMMSSDELDTVRRFGGRMHKINEVNESQTSTSSAANWNKTRVLISDLSLEGSKNPQLGHVSGKLGGIYENYLLVRPYPSLRVLFASPSLRMPGILQSKFMDKIGGSQRVHDELTQALADGRGVTAKVRWVSKNDPEGRSRWIHCTPLLGVNSSVGVWMIVIVDEERAIVKSYRQAPPVESRIGKGPRERARGEESRNNRLAHNNMRKDGMDGGVKDFLNPNAACDEDFDLERVRSGSFGALSHSAGGSIDTMRI